MKKTTSTAAAIVATAQDFNAIFATKTNPATSAPVNRTTGEHYNNIEAGIFGLEQLVRAILRGKSNATFPEGAEQTELRAAVIGAAMYSDEIVGKVREAFGGDRYGENSIRVYLSQKAKGLGCVQLTGKEDSGRPCPRPRCKYFLLACPLTEKEQATI